MDRIAAQVATLASKAATAAYHGDLKTALRLIGEYLDVLESAGAASAAGKDESGKASSIGPNAGSSSETGSSGPTHGDHRKGK